MLSPAPLSFLDHIKRCNNARLDEFEPWFIGTERAGFLHRDFAPVVAARKRLFARRGKAWQLDPALDTADKRTAAMRGLLLSGATTARDTGSRLDVALAIRSATVDGVIAGPRLLVVGAPITTTAGHYWFLGGEADTTDAVPPDAGDEQR